MQGYFINRGKTGTVGLSGREVLIVGWLVCLDEWKSPVDPRRDPRTKNWGGYNGEKRICG